ncbi:MULTISPECIES: 3-methyl-2-oxobutanoate hydroxymethyltransferase [Pseudomonas]|jgi:3-methyl-2-oxobutanoate hydroxymethyltransferase|uniref:3-methyl-2-oxobutanoate hydroxymethyltransferase n=5 Tax=Pseudomonadota TaxID=1224 RepID=A0A7U9CQM2_PSEFL|nr:MULTISPECIES: 3-methyl-2-oxobutanoate hydroxymethyltransferase [Pseudomonas]RBB97443.1 3-methyl-2-oxobutanoate hydroxymethyltransferase [Pseudomonas sp. MWU12-2115]RBL68019.1 3-methyl-2-oxobutanoate hydroxymethyltransferase [Pseudomonas sp. MWU13-2625]EJZ57995.1 3-methyl-2-oxobutanoate hydroxymethyltransferase [Pseudomonas fluorescens R124]MBK5344352.1 3-methyl-2-oxobutanoate hydroxymethyltransferase [Pseudomonas sp. TH49]MBY8960170.1 3-methyl-2-oxobutanoate hydroxymethyltransferase [Pseudo
MTEHTSPYDTTALTKPATRLRIPQLKQMKVEGRKWAMLTAYDMYSAVIFEDAGIPVLLVGDSASNNVFGNDSTLAVTVDELLPLVRAVTRSTRRALVIADLPFGSYQVSPEQCLQTAVRFMKEAGAHAVKIEGGVELLPHIAKLSVSGIPVMAHIGFTPQMEHQLGGYRVQGRGEDGQRLIDSAKALEAAGAFALLIEMVPGDVGAAITQAVAIPTVGIGAGNQCDAQVLVWQDMAGLRQGRLPRFVKQYADLRSVLQTAARDFADDVQAGTFPGPEHTF